eukprot:TRINITY_DN258_c0_g1_i2.p1 TRINITY_DN258_c0_g1~~TRINITY_DN258_c0_g1_i2.p1  ORF type:complete len:310 (-),score=95.86 TRINITY_DN258_c0_g1_i2:169-1098(-)
MHPARPFSPTYIESPPYPFIYSLCIQSLCSHKFHSFPVLQQDKNKWYGFVDVLDIIKYVIDNDHFGAKIGDESSLWKAFPKFVAELPEFSNKTVNDVMVYPLSRRNPFHPIVNTLSLFTAVEAMARIPNLHRVPIVDEDRKLKAILTQSNVINWLHQRLDMLGAKGDIQVKNMRGVLRDVKSVSEVEHKAIDAFNLMVSENVTGVAVTNKNGELVETISAVDLKTLATDGQLFWRLYQKIPEFLKHLKADWAKDHRPHDVVSATPESTLRQVICILAEKQVHRLFIVDDNKKPVGVISLRDVLSAVLGF